MTNGTTPIPPKTNGAISWIAPGVFFEPCSSPAARVTCLSRCSPPAACGDSTPRRDWHWCWARPSTSQWMRRLMRCAAWASHCPCTSPRMILRGARSPSPPPPRPSEAPPGDLVPPKIPGRRNVGGQRVRETPHRVKVIIRRQMPPRPPTLARVPTPEGSNYGSVDRLATGHHCPASIPRRGRPHLGTPQVDPRVAGRLTTHPGHSRVAGTLPTHPGHSRGGGNHPTHSGNSRAIGKSPV